MRSSIGTEVLFYLQVDHFQDYSQDQNYIHEKMRVKMHEVKKYIGSRSGGQLGQGR